MKFYVVKIAVFLVVLSLQFNSVSAYGVEQSEKEIIRDELLNDNNLSIEGNKIEVQLLKDIYSKNDYQPIWLEEEKISENAMKLISFVSKAEENGLDKSKYSHKLMTKRIADLEGDKSLKTDILFTQFFVGMVHDIYIGQDLPEYLEKNRYFEKPKRTLNYNKALDEFKAIENEEPVIENFILKYSPKHEQYKNLKTAIKNIIAEREKQGEIKKISKGADIKPSNKDNRIPAIRSLLKSPRPINPSAAKDIFIYDKELFKAVTMLQKSHGLKDDGVINDKFISLINLGYDGTIKKVAINMERYRWLPDELEDKRIEINIPEFKLHAYEDGKLKFSSAAIVGREGKKTPMLKTEMTEVVFHPYWHVPRSYATKLLLPIIQKDENYLQDEEFNVIKLNPDGTWQGVIDAASVDWSKVNENNFNYILRQDPGKKNALGPIKFNILNNMSIYLHGTSEPWLFNAAFRANSSGCIRVENPLEVAHFVLQDNKNYKDLNIDELYKTFDNNYDIPYYDKPKHQKLALDKSLAFYSNYFTVKANKYGELEFFEDIYNWDELGV